MKYNHLKILFIFMLQLLALQTYSQQKKLFTLDEAIEMARTKSISSYKSRTLKENKFWQWKAFKSNYLPQLSLDGLIPDYRSTYDQIMQPDGSVQYHKLEYNSSSLNLSLNQYIPLTGSKIYASSSILRYDDFVKNENIYNNNPFVIGINQPIFKFDPLKWDKKIEPLKYEESQKEFVQEMEQIALITSGYYFDVLLAQKNEQIARENLANDTTLYQIAIEKSKLGKLSKNDLLQLKLATINDRKSLSQANLEYSTALLEFKTFIGITDESEMVLNIPEQIIKFGIDPKQALEEAWKNRSEIISFKRKLLEADRQIAEAKGNNGFNADLNVELGYSNSNANFAELYQDPIDRQIVSLSFYIPIADWGKAKSQRKVAIANKQLTEFVIKQEEVNFEKNIKTEIEQFKILVFQVKMNDEAQQIADERNKISIERFKLGDITITDLNIAANENNRAKQDYYLTLKKYWEAYYRIRLLTMYDFENQKIIEYQ